ncbi:Swt1 family HEPN domain-containing protein [Hymenobacter sp. 5317J-9]|uniref:Swt1 family HEPN domain-containing protein n=1 Tax=Hymenobacter sp. 5317J-9 TaxID=2932250 RepID=UPI001FD662F4|nr:Swt1 family HEPN domain-containing protein [Hymenobacter sp. 5317J-9]UOQ97319.1 Swt1 family HEPN domain-containing protein [Hymenobacter sp. 5317J-9]
MNEKQALQDVENVLRDYISAVLENKFGQEWVTKCGLPEDRIKKWGEKLEVEKKKQRYSTCDPRIIYYSDFYDLGNILGKNWELFKSAFGEKKELDVFLGILENCRNSNAHGRELLSYQKHLAIGIAGEIRNRITKFRSMEETGESYFPRLESVHDNYGNSWKIGESAVVRTKTVLRVGDILEFIVSATDPQGERLEYIIWGKDWQDSSNLQLELTNRYVSLDTSILIVIRSKREFHASIDGTDDSMMFKYQVLPPLTSQLARV